MKTKISDSVFIATLLFGIGLLFLLSLRSGPAQIPFNEILSFRTWTVFSEKAVILQEIRLPRSLLAVLVGMSLGLCGAAMQGYLRNPLAEPGILGVSGGAALGSILVFYTGLSSKYLIALPLGGLGGAFAMILLVYALAGSRSSIQTLVLAGLALNALAFALTTFFLYMIPNPYARLEILFWQQGSLLDRSLDHVMLAAPWILIGTYILMKTARDLDALTLGEEAAASLGVNLRRLRWKMILGVAFAVGGAVSICGNIAFVGLVVPHFIRPWVRNQPGKLLGFSALGGALLLLAADILVRWIPIQGEIKLGVLTSLLGAPFFIYLVFRMRRCFS